MSSVSNVDKKTDKQRLRDSLMIELCKKYRHLKGNKGYTDFIFPLDDIRKSNQEDGFGITGWERPYLDELLRMIQEEDRFVEVLNGDKFRLTQDGINRCRQID